MGNNGSVSIFKRLRESWQNFWGSNYSYGSHLTTEFIDDENFGWEALRHDAQSFSQELFSEADRNEIRTMSQFLYHFSDHYRGLVRTYIKYCFGKQYQLVSDDEDANAAWAAWKKKRKFRQFSKEIGRRFYRDGEVIIHVPDWRFINPALLCSPEKAEENIHSGVEDDGMGKVVAYWFLQGKEFQRVDAADMIYVGEKDQDEWRALPYFISALSTCSNHKKWMRDRILLNRIRAQIGLERIHKNTSPTQGAAFAEAKKTTTIPDKTTRYGETMRRKVLEPGQILDHGESIEYKYLAPNLQSSDVAADGRQLVLSIAAAVGLPEYMVSGDSSNANYASHLVSEGAAVKEFDSWMEFFAETFLEIWHKVMIQAEIESDDAPLDDPTVTLPSVVMRNALQETQRNEILFSNGVISVDTWRSREGVPLNEGDKVDFSDLQ